MRGAILLALVASCSNRSSDPVVRDWQEEVDSPLTVPVRVGPRNGMCIAIAGSDGTKEIDALKAKCAKQAYQVYALVRPGIMGEPFYIGKDGACRDACRALSYADRGDARYTTTASEIAARCGDCKGATE